MRLIDAHDVLGKIEKMETVDIVDVVENIILSPTIEAVPVIRCKDCKFYQENYMGRKVCFDSGMVRNSIDFCSQAKRKADADEKKQAYDFTITCLTENVETLTQELERFMSDEVGAENWTMCRELIEEEE